MKAIRLALRLVREFRRPYLALNLAYYGLILGAMIFTAFNRPLQQTLLAAVGKAWKSGPLSPIFGAYLGGNVVYAAALTFLLNLFAGSFVSITLPSLVIPYSGFLVGALRAVLWGLIFSPTTLDTSGPKLIGVSLMVILLLLEGQGYILTMLAAYVQGKALLDPESVGAETRWHGYLFGVRRSMRLYALVALVLAAAAVYEAVVGICVIPRLR